MDPAGFESIEPSELRSEKVLASVGGKRLAENDGDLGARLQKKARSDSDGDMKRIAEIVLVLSAMGNMRGGRTPTDVEKVLMSEAREKLAKMCESLAPEDILPKDAVRVVIEDLGLNRSRDPKLGFRPPKVSIAEKLLLTKRKMEESKEFAAKSATYPSKMQQTGGFHRFPPDKPSLAPTSAFQPASSMAHVSTSSSSQFPVNEVQSATVSRGFPSSPLEKDSSSLPLPRMEATHFRLDGRLNGPAYVSQIRANPSGDHLLEKAPTLFQPVAVAKIGQANKAPDHTPIKIVGAPDISTSQVALQATRDQNSNPSATQTAFGSLPSVHQPLQGMDFVQASSLYTNHYDIARSVQKFLQPRLPVHPNWTPPSIDYMNKALTCQICKVTINDVESLLVCDACEKGVHLKCIQSYNQKGVLKLEWHCPKCLLSSNGKPLPPKYGRVTRNISGPKVSSNTTGVQASSEKNVESSLEKVHHEKVTANGNPGLPNPVQVTSPVSNHLVSSAAQKMSNARETPGFNFSANRIKIEGGAYCNIFPPKAQEATEIVSVPPLSGTPNESSDQHIQNSKSSPCDAKSSISESKSLPVFGPGCSCAEKLSDISFDACHHSQGPCNSQDVDKTRPPNCAEVSANQYHVNNPVSKEFESSDLETSECKPRCERRDDQVVVQPSFVGTLDVGNGARDCTRSSLDGLHSVDWVGDILQVVDEKTFYHSCCVNGVVYNLLDHALFRFDNDSLTPSKLQALWEDNKTRSKWAVVNRCYLPSDLPEIVGRPYNPENNEVYESNHESTVMAGLILGPCEVLPPNMIEDREKNHLGHSADDKLQPVFLCKWFYDDSKRLFRPISD